MPSIKSLESPCPKNVALNNISFSYDGKTPLFSGLTLMLPSQGFIVILVLFRQWEDYPAFLDRRAAETHLRND